MNDLSVQKEPIYTTREI